MDEKELLDLPESNETSIDDDDFFNDVDNEVIEENQKNSNEEESSETNEESSNEGEEIDYKPFLEAIEKKAKYNKESVKVDNIDEVINNFQKGLNYDKLQEKLNNLENGKALTYVTKKAQELGMSVDEYMDQVEKYEAEQERQREAEELQDLIDKGIPQETAEELVSSRQLRKELQEIKNKLAESEKQKSEAQREQDEYNEFFKEFPNINVEKDIPSDVFLNAHNNNISLTRAYKDYLYEKTVKELEILKNNEKNSNSAVGSTQNFAGSQENTNYDPFLEGFDS